MELIEMEILSSIFENVVICSSIIFGGWWAIHKFKIFREGKPNPQLDLEYEILPYNEESSLLVMTVHIGNIGKIDMYPKSISLSLRSLPKNFSIGKSPHWKDGNVILDEFDVIYDANPDLKPENTYMLPPNDKYLEIATLVISKTENLLMAKILYLGKDKSEFSIYKVLRI